MHIEVADGKQQLCGMEAESANIAEEVPEMSYRLYPLCSHWPRGPAEASQFQWTQILLPCGEGTRLQMLKACHDFKNQQNKLQNLDFKLWIEVAPSKHQL